MAISQKYNSNAINSDSRTGINLAQGVFEAVVMDNIDPLLQGRLAVYIPELGGEINDPGSWRIVRYASPFYGITPYRDSVLGTQSAPAPDTTEASGGVGTSMGGFGLVAQVGSRLNADALASAQGQGAGGGDVITSYGMWAVPPDLGVTVLVMFAGGELNRGFWFACVPTLAHGMVPAIGAPDGKTPMAEFNPIDPNVVVTDDLSSFERQPYQPLVDSLTAQGLQEDPARGPITSSSFREAPSNVFGISSKGGHTFVMDDGSQDGTNKLIRFRTAGGNQITMNDDTGFVYIINAQGTGWIELGASGQIDVFGAAGINLATNGDINMHADKNVKIHAGECLQLVGMKATKIMGGEEMQMHGRKTMIEGVDSLHIHSCTEIMITSFQDIHVKAFNYMCQKAKCFLFNSCTAKEAEQVPPEQPEDLSGYKTTVLRAPSHEPYKEHDGAGQGPAGAGAGGVQPDGTGRPGGQSSPGSGVVVGGNTPYSGGNAGVSGWWTADRQAYAADYLTKNAGLSQAGAAGLVSRWTLEAPGGPTSVNPNGGASGIAQWLGSRKTSAATSGDFDQQLSYAAQELNGSEKRAGDLLRSATDADSAARGATAYERAEYYNPSTNTDVLTKQTADRYNTVYENTTKGKSPTDSTSTTPGTSVSSSTSKSTAVNTTNPSGSNGPYDNGGGAGKTFTQNVNTTNNFKQGFTQTSSGSYVTKSATPVKLQNAVKTTSGNTTTYTTATYNPSTSTTNGYSAGAPTTSVKPSTITVNQTKLTSTASAGFTGKPDVSSTTTSKTIDTSSPEANQYLGRGGAQPVGADPALANVDTGQANPDQATGPNAANATPAQEASDALSQTGGQGTSSDLPAAPGGGQTGCFATGDNCARPADETGGNTAGSGDPNANAAQTNYAANDPEGKAAAEEYLGRPMSDSEYSALVAATNAEAGTNQTEQAYVSGTILNRVRARGEGATVQSVLGERGQFESVTGPGGNSNYVNGPNSTRAASINGSMKNILPSVPKNNYYFDAANPAAYKYGSMPTNRGGVAPIRIGASRFYPGAKWN